jgi:cohesin complex subunit SA-1/2
VLNHAVDTIRHLLGAVSLANTNSQKILELEDELSSALRDAIGGRDELEAATFSDDEVHALSAIAMRVGMLFEFRDLSAWMEEDEGGKQSNAWDILAALAERGALGYKEEAQVLYLQHRALSWSNSRVAC